MKHNNDWDHALTITAGGKGLVGHAGAVLLRKAADQTGLAGQLSEAMLVRGSSPLLDRGIVLVSMAIAIALGAASMSDIALLAHLAPLLGTAASSPTVRRTLDLAGDKKIRDRIARARARARAHAWNLIAQTERGFPWLEVAGKTLTGWVVIDMDATLITAHSEKEKAAPTWKKGYGFHPLAAWCRNTRECLAMLLRPGNAGSNTFTDHREVLTAAIRQVPSRFRRRILVRVDGAGASHDLIGHLLSLSSPRRTLRFTCGWTIRPEDEDAIKLLPASAWKPGTCQDGAVEEDKAVAEITHLMTRAENWPGSLRWVVRRVKPSRLAAREAHPVREADRVALLHHLRQHTGRRPARGSRQPSPAVHRRAAPRARLRRDRRRPHRQGHGAPGPAVEDIPGQRGVGARGEHRRRPHRLDPPPRPPR